MQRISFPDLSLLAHCDCQPFPPPLSLPGLHPLSPLPPCQVCRHCHRSRVCLCQLFQIFHHRLCEGCCHWGNCCRRPYSFLSAIGVRCCCHPIAANAMKCHQCKVTRKRQYGLQGYQKASQGRPQSHLGFTIGPNVSLKRMQPHPQDCKICGHGHPS